MGFDAQVDNLTVHKTITLADNTVTFVNSDGNDILAALNELDSLSATELGYVDGVTAGTAVASKAVVLGSAKNIATITTATITDLTATNVNSTTGNITEVVCTNVNATTGTISAISSNGIDVTGNTVGFFNANAASQPAAIANANNNGDNLAAQVNSVIAALETLGLIASS